VLSHVGLHHCVVSVVKLGEVAEIRHAIAVRDGARVCLVPELSLRRKNNRGDGHREYSSAIFSAVGFGIRRAPCSHWFRWLDMAGDAADRQPQNDPKVALGPLIIVCSSTASGRRDDGVRDLLFSHRAHHRAADCARWRPIGSKPTCQGFKGSRWPLLNKIQLPDALPHVFSGMKVDDHLAVVRPSSASSSAPTRARYSCCRFQSRSTPPTCSWR